MNRRAFIAAAAGVACGALVLAAGCTNSDAPAEPVWGKEPCAHCAMVLSDKRFAAQLVTSAGDRYHFDDVGCMVSFIAERSVTRPRAWVHDAGSNAWIDARAARYAGGAPSPMDFGFEPRPDGSITWDDVQRRVLEKKRKAP